MPSGVGNGCSCDPAIDTTDCDTSPCAAFMGVFLTLELIVLICYVVVIALLEYFSWVHKKRAPILWRIILPSCCFACLAKVIRLGILANENTRFKVSQVALVFLYNTHLCFATVGFITLLFFWARLRHDLKADTRIFGKLLPGYIIVISINIFFYYAQVVVKGTTNNNSVMFLMLVVNGLVSVILALIFFGYTISVWNTFLKNTDTSTLFYKTYVSALLTSIFIIAFCVELLVSNVTSFDTTRQYLIKHAIYEILFLLQVCSIPSGFVLHSYRRYISKTEKMSGTSATGSGKGSFSSQNSHNSDNNSNSTALYSLKMESASASDADSVPA